MGPMTSAPLISAPPSDAASTHPASLSSTAPLPTLHDGPLVLGQQTVVSPLEGAMLPAGALGSTAPNGAADGPMSPPDGARPSTRNKAALQRAKRSASKFLSTRGGGSTPADSAAVATGVGDDSAAVSTYARMEDASDMQSRL